MDKKQMEKNKRGSNFPIYIPEDLKDRLKKVAEKHKVKMTAVVLSGIESKVSELEKKQSIL